MIQPWLCLRVSSSATVVSNILILQYFFTITPSFCFISVIFVKFAKINAVLALFKIWIASRSGITRSASKDQTVRLHTLVKRGIKTLEVGAIYKYIRTDAIFKVMRFTKWSRNAAAPVIVIGWTTWKTCWIIARWRSKRAQIRLTWDLWFE